MKIWRRLALTEAREYVAGMAYINKGGTAEVFGPCMGIEDFFYCLKSEDSQVMNNCSRSIEKEKKDGG